MTTKLKTQTTSIDPSRLAPDFDNIPGPLTAKEFTFWLGLTSDCPCGQIDVAGLHFPRAEEDIVINEVSKFEFLSTELLTKRLQNITSTV